MDDLGAPSLLAAGVKEGDYLNFYATPVDSRGNPKENQT